ncbi:MAG TPA: electron transfer flavoprotein subunit alpha/FixB family protein [Bacteroidia bacterium]|nr:electron transfer flavoprotein subunit alpha/FixB family protein [Bacteroidia bacterium]HRS57982.1 electron transfer flavoprotein subunit alpha/FixB family protein [Bacteroidia bacterium]HRU68563.1 electron transfer flavoprotein subunit alpha/FixB family protein [Bacteroidia bacterium]
MAVLVYTENWDGKFKKLSYELVSYAYGIALQINTEVVALTTGNVDEPTLLSLGNYGASKIICIQQADNTPFDPMLVNTMIAETAEKINANVIVFAHNNTGKAIAPRLSARLKAGLVTAATALPSALSPFVVKKKLFSGKAFANIEITTPTRIITLSQNSFGVVENTVHCTIEYITASSSEGSGIEVINVSKQTGKVLLTDAEIVVSGGRGMKGPENWGPIEELAELLGGATACSRPVSDEGWRPHSEHTGQTGKIIAPNLYLAFGISGAIQHVAGVSSSKVIAAVNKDPEAPIFEVADYGIVGDALKILPELINEVKKLKNS